jgi:tripartite-type tricarboxylate transporter receptor subunit TctC
MRATFSTVAAMCFGLSLVNTIAHADEYPSKPIKIIVGFAPGGPADAVARGFAQRLATQFKSTVVVENRSGADGNIALDLVARAAPDGYTLLLTQNGLTVNPSLYRRVPFDAIKDFAPIAFVGEGTNFVAVATNVPGKDLQEMLAYAKRAPDPITYAATSSPNELASELIAQMADVKFTRVPYKGAAPAIPDLVAGRLQMMVSNIGTLLPHVKSGRIKALAVTSLKRSTLAPDVPTVSESGLSGYTASTWYGVVAPAATPRSIIERLHAEFRKAMDAPDLSASLLAQAVETKNMTIPEFTQFIQEDLAKWEKVVKASGGKRE